MEVVDATIVYEEIPADVYTCDEPRVAEGENWYSSYMDYAYIQIGTLQKEEFLARVEGWIVATMEYNIASEEAEAAADADDANTDDTTTVTQ